MVNKSILYSIDLYQKYLSPHKGYCCAYKVYHDDVSCSEFTKNSIKDVGFIQSILIIKQRFKECKISSERIKEEKECCQSEGFKRFDNCVGNSCKTCEVASCFGFLFSH
jgi:putative component of membrane protein insertase Oxa1/YidC/SpoIIIJ protein YidD